MDVIGFFSRKSKLYVTLLGGFLVALLGAINTVVGREVSFSIFYLLPIVFVGWFAGRWQALVISVLSAATWLSVDLTRNDFSSFDYSLPVIPYWNALVRLGFFLIVIFLLSQLRKMNNQLEAKVLEQTKELRNEVNERKRANEGLRALSAHLQTVREEERQTIARELHDELAQTLTGVKMELATLNDLLPNDTQTNGFEPLLNKIQAMENTVDASIGSVRRIMTDLRPVILDRLGLIPAIEWLVEEFRTKSKVACLFSLPGEDFQLDKERSTAIFRILQESFNNIARHAQASKVKLEMYIEEGTLYLEINDDGRGAAEAAMQNPKSFGITGMRERALLLGGALDIRGEGGKGTSVLLRMPLREAGEQAIHD
jgi:signal transduction histidine kinase